MGKEMHQLADAFDWGLDDFEWITINADQERICAVPRAIADHQRASSNLAMRCCAPIKTSARWSSQRPATLPHRSAKMGACPLLYTSSSTH